jgi:hypothetical protein
MIKGSDAKQQAMIASKPTKVSSLRAYYQEIATLRQQVHAQLVKDNKEEPYTMIMQWVEEWNKDPTLLEKHFEKATAVERSALLDIDSIVSYTKATDYQWYGATIIEVEVAAQAYGINILIWDIMNTCFQSYVYPDNERYCILAKGESHHYDILHLVPSKWKFISTWTLDELGPTLKCLFNLNSDVKTNMEFYQDPDEDGV